MCYFHKQEDPTQCHKDTSSYIRLICGVNTMPVKPLTGLFMETDKVIPNYTWKSKWPRRFKAPLEIKR